jgi:hypothetical protein
MCSRTRGPFVLEPIMCYILSVTRSCSSCLHRRRRPCLHLHQKPTPLPPSRSCFIHIIVAALIICPSTGSSCSTRPPPPSPVVTRPTGTAGPCCSSSPSFTPPPSPLPPPFFSGSCSSSMSRATTVAPCTRSCAHSRCRYSRRCESAQNVFGFFCVRFYHVSFFTQAVLHAAARAVGVRLSLLQVPEFL